MLSAQPKEPNSNHPDTNLDQQSIDSELCNGFIQSITIKNYKTIKNLENFPLRNINILIGANGAGKSNFLKFWQLFKTILLGSQDRLDEFVIKQGSADSILCFGKKHSLTVEYLVKLNSSLLYENWEKEQVEWFCSNQSLYQQFLQNHGAEFKLLDINNIQDLHKWFLYHVENIIVHLSISATGWIVRDDFFKFQGLSSILYTEFTNMISYVNRNVAQKIIDNIQQYHFHDTTATSPILSSQPLYQNDKLFSDGGNIAPFIYRIYKHYPQNYDLLVRTIRALVPDFYSFHIDTQLKDTDHTSLFWLNRNDLGSDNVKKYHPVLLSDGSLRIICLLTVLLQPKELMPKIILIDEPELGLHPQAIDLIAQIIQDVSEHTQFIIATQSPAFINLFSPNDIVVVNKNADGTSGFNRLDANKLTNWLKDYSLSELWYKNILGGQP